MPKSAPVRPVRMNAAQNDAAPEAILRSQARLSAKPPPNAGPLTEATTICGVRLGCAVSEDMKDCPVEPARRCGWSPTAGGTPHSFRSRPLQKARPLPVRTMTLQESSAAKSSRAS